PDERLDRLSRRGERSPAVQGSALSGRRFSVGDGCRSLGAATVRLPLPAAARRHEQLGGGPADSAEVFAVDQRSALPAAWRRYLCELARQLRQARHAAVTERRE